jgi:uncharacterized protein (DUF1684 family)
MDVATLRREKDRFFGQSHESPLRADQRRSFTGLRYFPDDPAYRFEVALEPDPQRPVEPVETSDGSTKELVRAGRLRFRVGDADAGLVAYEQDGDLFVPFRDRTSGDETYGAGRYVEAEALGGGRYLLDFNRAYNPYCAYNENWSCPLPPRENWLSVAIRAGELTYPHEDAR